MLSFRIKLLHTILIQTWKNCSFFTVFISWLFHTFLYKWVFFEKIKTSQKACFYIMYTICRTFLNSFFIKLFYKNVSFYLRWEQNYISKLHSMMTHILMSWFKESTERRKFSKRTRRKMQTYIKPYQTEQWPPKGNA